MFYHIKGELITVDGSAAVIECGEIGYKLTVSLLTADALQAKIGSTVRLFTHLQVREDGIELFGFYTDAELTVFRLLNTVSGVGPKASMGILSAFTPENFTSVVCSEDTKSLAKAPGIGAKTAARIILELKEKLGGEALSALPVSGGRQATSPARMSGKLSEAAEVLTGLGYSRAEATDVLRTLDITGMSLEEIVTAALKTFAKP